MAVCLVNRANDVMSVALPILFAVFIWWFSTGVVMLLDGLPRTTFRWSHLISTLLALGAGRLLARVGAEQVEPGVLEPRDGRGDRVRREQHVSVQEHQHLAAGGGGELRAGVRLAQPPFRQRRPDQRLDAARADQVGGAVGGLLPGTRCTTRGVCGHSRIRGTLRRCR